MGFLDKIQRHIAMATGNFPRLFKEFDIPPLESTAARLIKELGKEEFDVEQVTLLLSSLPAVSARILRTVNSAFFSLPTSVKSLKQAVALLGVRHVRAIVLAHTAQQSLPVPEGGFFDSDAFWQDALLRALFARLFAARRFSQEEAEEAFTAALLLDIALPVLLIFWNNYYEPVVEKWKKEPERLSSIEYDHFGWDHGQAGAWIAQKWEFPSSVVCLVALHTKSLGEISRLDLDTTIALPVAVAALLPSCLKEDPKRQALMMEMAKAYLHIHGEEMADIIRRASHLFKDALDLFDVSLSRQNSIFKEKF